MVKKLVRKVKKTHRKRVNKAKGANAQHPLFVKPLDLTVQKLNPFGHNDKKGYRFVKRYGEAVCDNFGINTAAGTVKNIIFDPSGTYGNAGAGAAQVALPEWSSFQQLFDQFKIDKIICRVRANDTASNGALQATQTSLLARYNYNSGSGAPTTLAAMSELPSVIRKVFTIDSPLFEYIITPMVEMSSYNGGLLSAQGRNPRKMGWTDITNAQQIYGLSLMSENGTDATTTLVISYEFQMRFRYHK